MGAWQEIADYTVPSNTTSVVLDSFGTITKDDFVKVVATIKYTASGTKILTANSSVTTNYHSQNLYTAVGGVFADRANNAGLHFVATNFNNYTTTYLKISENNVLNYFTTFHERETDIGSGFGFTYNTSSGTTFPSGITSLTFSSSIAAGSRIQIYKLAATKVADITVASNTTQVDISNLSIDKDSEYLLVSDISPSATTNIVLAVNDVTATNQYYYQVLAGIGSTTYAIRENQGLMIYLPSGRKGLLHSHIKLSNIGAFTAQNYGILDYGTSNLELVNRFQSSTAENITSITKLNFVASASNGITAGSRFMLYKLY